MVSKTDGRFAGRGLIILGLISSCVYAVIALLSRDFAFDSPTTDRPIVVVLVLFATAFAVYLLAIRMVVQAQPSRNLMRFIFASALFFRLILLVSLPIQEVDIYRYLWDGAVSANSVNPFRYCPDQVLGATGSRTEEPDLQRLRELRAEPTLDEILQRVHFGELPTIYPPVSQLVFAGATLVTPTNASIWCRLVIMKSIFIAFDMATLVLVMRLLQRCGMHRGLCLIYAWCPLLIKEVANSGHLDAVAVFLTTLAIYLFVRWYADRDERKVPIAECLNASGIALVLSLAVGAKLYPIVLVPLFLTSSIRRLGWWRTSLPAATFVATTWLLLWPMLPSDWATLHDPREAAPPAPTAALGPPIPAGPTDAIATDPSSGVTTFLRSWEMNDFLFLLLVENMKPSEFVTEDQRPWFVVVPDSRRVSMVSNIASSSHIEPGQVPFLVTRGITAILFIGVAVWFAWRASRTSDMQESCRYIFLTLAWFWLLCPTQNPWYWTWALPLLAFARSRAWLMMSGLLFLYYLRFWLGYHWPSAPVWGTPYSGHAFFDFVVTWIEFLPWFVCLFAETCVRWWNTRRARSQSTNARNHTPRRPASSVPASSVPASSVPASSVPASSVPVSSDPVSRVTVSNERIIVE